MVEWFMALSFDEADAVKYAAALKEMGIDIAADEEENTAAEVYDDAADNDLLSVNPIANTLNLVLRDEGTMRFVKYVGFQAASSRWDVANVFEIEYSDDEGDESNEEGASGPVAAIPE